MTQDNRPESVLGEHEEHDGGRGEHQREHGERKEQLGERVGHTTKPTPPALALDIGGTKIAAGAVDITGQLLVSFNSPTANATNSEELFSQLCDLADQVLVALPTRPEVCGVGSGGPMRNKNRLVSPLNIPIWRDFSLRDRLEQHLKMPTHVENDAKALALGEGWVGAAKGVKNYIAMVVSTGIGGGIVLEGRLLHGADFNAGHIGHVFVEPDGHPDAAGARGNLEGQASGSAILAKTGQPPAQSNSELRQQVGVWVGRAVASVANLLDLQLAVVSGSVALGFGDVFFESAQATIDELCRLDFSKGTKIIPGKLKHEGPLIGAGAVGFQSLGLLEL